MTEYKLLLGSGTHCFEAEVPVKNKSTTKTYSVYAKFCGMPNDHTFSISKLVDISKSNNDFVSVNEFYPVTTQSITLWGERTFSELKINFAIKEVTPEYLLLEYIASVSEEDQEDKEGRLALAQGDEDEGNLSLEDLTE